MDPLRATFPVLRACVGESSAVQVILNDLVEVAGTRYPVLLEGESGTGKELLARLIHKLATEDKAPFEAINCGAIPDGLVESELFGHVAGAFTGAVHVHRGVFERARLGTVFLDEITELPLQAQVKLLRVLQEGTFRPVGGEELRTCRARIVAATNRDLRREVHAGRFREDLYYRLNVYPICIPPLRERREDIPPLLEHFLARDAAELGRPAPRVDSLALRRLLLYSYPGNVRELQNIVRGLLIEARKAATITDRHVVAVFSRHRLHESARAGHAGLDASAGAAPAAMVVSEEDDQTHAGRHHCDEIGLWVLNQMRCYHFNVALAEKMLVARRHAAMDPHTIPVCSRSGLTYYLQGECLRALAQEHWDLEAAALCIAGSDALVSRVRRRIATLHAGAIAALRSNGQTRSDRRAALRRSFAKLPETYAKDLERFASEFEGGRWGSLSA